MPKPYYTLITGAAGGIGFETASNLAGRGAPVIVTARSQEKADDALRRITARFPKRQLDLLALPLDLCDLNSIDALCASLAERDLLLRCLICNAGSGGARGSVYGLQKLWVNNFLGHFHLVRSLMPLLQKTARYSGECSRIVHVSSVMHRFSSAQALLSDVENRRRSRRVYAHSKLAQVLFSFELHRRYFTHPDGGVASVAVNPGGVNSTIWRYIPPPLSWVTTVLFRVIWLDCEEGSRTSVYATSMPVEEGGQYYLTPYHASSNAWLNAALDVWGWSASPKLSRANSDAYSLDATERLWQLCETQIKDIKGLETTPYATNDD